MSITNHYRRIESDLTRFPKRILFAYLVYGFAK